LSHQEPALTDKATRVLLNAPPTRSYLTSSQDNYKYHEIEGFLRLPSTRDPSKGQAYRPTIHAEKDQNSDSSTDEEKYGLTSSDEGSDTEDGISLTSHQLAVKAAEDRLKQDPSNQTAWLDLLSFSLSSIPPLSKDAPKARGEITISVLDRAFKASIENYSSVRLWLKYLAASEEVQEPDKLRNTWEKALDKAGKGADQADIWVAWLDWIIRRGAGGIVGIVGASTRAMLSLRSNEIGRLRIFWRVAVAFRDAGYSERATALFQAQAELYV
jgi:hypothetical protein